MFNINGFSGEYAKDWLEKKYGKDTSPDGLKKYCDLTRACRSHFLDWDSLPLSSKVKKHVRNVLECLERIRQEAERRQEEQAFKERQERFYAEFHRQREFEEKILTMSDEELLQLWISEDPEVAERLARTL